MNRSCRVLACVASGAAVLTAVVACGPATSSTSSTSGSSVFTIAQTELTTTIDPIQSTSGYGALLAIRNVYEGLLAEVPGTLKLKPDLATSWTDSGNKVWTFTLRKGVKFTDGTPFNSQAVVFNYDRVMKIGGGISGYLSDVASVVADGPYKVTITLKQPQTDFLDTAAVIDFVSPTAALKHQVKGDLGTAWLQEHAVGTGPYEVTSFVPGQDFVMKQNPNYWGGWKKNQVTEIVVTQVPSMASQIEELERGTIDKVDNPIEPYETQLKESKNLTLMRAPGTEIDGIFLNTEHGPFTNLKVRQAAVLAYNYKAAGNAAYDGNYQVPRGPLPADFAGFDTALPPIKTNVAEAKNLLESSGDPHPSVTIEYMTGLDFEKDEAAVFQQSLDSIGFSVTVRSVPWVQLSTDAAPQDEPDARILWYAPFTADPTGLLQEYFDSNQTMANNWANFQDPKVDSLLAEASAAPNVATRNSLLAQVQQIIVDDAPVIFAANQNKLEVINKNFTGYVLHPIDVGYTIWFYDLRVK